MLEDLALELELERISYAYLRGQGQLPRVPAGSLLTMLVAPEAAAAFERVLEHACARRGATLEARTRTGHRRLYRLQAYEQPGCHTVVELELRSAETLHGVTYLPARRLLAARVAQSPRTLPRDLSALIDFLEPYLAHGDVERRLALRLRNVAADRARRLRGLLASLVGHRRAALFLRALLTEDEAALRASARPFRRALLARAFLRRPLESTLEALRSALPRPPRTRA